MADLTLRISDLNTRITFQEPVESQDAGAAQTFNYVQVQTDPEVWANVLYDHGTEQIQSEAKQATLRATVTVRHRSDVLATWRILMNGQPWNLIAPPEPVQNRNRWLVFRIEQAKGSI